MEADLVFSFGNEVIDSGKCGNEFDCGRGLFGCASRPRDQQVEVTRCFAAATKGARRRYPLKTRESQQVEFDAACRIGCLVDAEASGASPVVVNALTNLLELLLPHARK